MLDPNEFPNYCFDKYAVVHSLYGVLPGLIEDQLDIDALSREGLISDCAVYAEQDSCDSDQLHNQV